MATDVRVRVVRRYWDEAWSRGRVEVLPELYAPAFRENDEDLTPQEFATHLTAWRQKFPDFTATVDRVFVCDDAVVSRVVYRGTHLGDFSFLPATGRSVCASGLDVFEFDDSDRIVQHWHEADHWQLFEQLGVQVSAGEAPG